MPTSPFPYGSFAEMCDGIEAILAFAKVLGELTFGCISPAVILQNNHVSVPGKEFGGLDDSVAGFVVGRTLQKDRKLHIHGHPEPESVDRYQSRD